MQAMRSGTRQSTRNAEDASMHRVAIIASIPTRPRIAYGNARVAAATRTARKIATAMAALR